MPQKAKTLAVIDAETDPFLWGRAPRPFLWGFFDGETFLLFQKTEALIQHLRAGNYLVYAHNGGKFDYQFMFDEADNGQEIKIINNRLAQWKIGKTTFRDSFMIFPQALKTTGEKKEIDYSKFEAGVRDQHMPEIIEYLKADCLALYNMVAKFRHQYGKGLTLAGTAMNEWSKMSGIKKPRSTAKFFEDFSPFYFGGRVQCFQHGIFDRTIKSYDLISAFPDAMTKGQPWGWDVHKVRRWPVDQEWGLSMVTCTAESLGQFPLRVDKHYMDPDGELWKGKPGLAFPHDGKIRRFRVSGWEAETAMRHGVKMEIESAWIFQGRISFSDYVHKFFKGKQEAPKGSMDREFFKILLNGLYGKFSANPSEYKGFLVDDFEAKAPEGYSLGDRIWPHAIFVRDLSDEEMHYFNVSVGAGITGYVRARLYDTFVSKFGKRFWESPDLFYCDTDCVHGSNFSLPESKALGGWELDFKARRALYAGKKMYGLEALVPSEKLDDKKVYSPDGHERKIRSKGVRLSWKELEHVAAGYTVEYKNPAPSYSPRTGLRWTQRTVRAT